MKNLRILLLFVAVLSFGLNSCQKPIVFVEGSGPGGTASSFSSSSMSAKVNGVLVQCNIAIAQIDPSGSSVILQINGLKDPEAFTLTFSDFKGTGSYNAADIVSMGSYVNGIANPFINAFNATSGDIKITSYVANKVIVGTFQYVAENSVGDIKNITEGKFSISLAPIPGPSTSVDDKSLSAKVDGTLNTFTGQANLLENAPIVGTTMTIIGINGVKNISVGIFDFKGVGDYILDPTKNQFQGDYSEDQSPSGSFSSESGKVTVTSYTATNIKGTFQFVAPNENMNFSTKKTITEGKFDVNYTKMKLP
jgi:hypothetical protein